MNQVLLHMYNHTPLINYKQYDTSTKNESTNSPRYEWNINLG